MSDVNDFLKPEPNSNPLEQETPEQEKARLDSVAKLDAEYPHLKHIHTQEVLSQPGFDGTPDPRDLEEVVTSAVKPKSTKPESEVWAKVAAASQQAKRIEPEEDDIIDIPEWPAPPASEAFAGLAGDFVSLWEPHTEADRAGLLIQFLVFAGHAIGREPYFVVSGDRHRCNLYALLVGPTSKGRKGQAYGCTKQTFDLVAPPSSTPFNGQASPAVLSPSESLPILHEASGLSSGEGLISAVRDESVGVDKKGQRVVTDFGVSDKRLLVFESEFAAPLRRMAKDGNTLSEVIRDCWDDKERLQTMTRNSPLCATKPYISIIGHSTRGDLSQYLNDVSLTNGFANRFMVIATKRIRLLPDPGCPRQEEWNAFARRLAKVIAVARTVKRMHRSLPAKKLWDNEIYKKLEASRTGRLHDSVCRRASPYVTRLSMIYALLDGCRHIESKHVRSALALWMYAERTSKYVFGDSLGDKVAEKVEKLLVEAGDSGLLTREIRQKVGDKKSVPSALRLLHELEKIRCEEDRRGDTKGRNGQRWFTRL